MATEPSTVSTRTIAVLVVVAALTLLYSVFVMAAPFAWVSAVVPLVALYLLWRLVRAHERLATAMEARTDAPASRADD